jgi:hypothetical protein
VYFNTNTYTGCLKIREFRIQSVVGKDPVELDVFLGGVLIFFFNFHIWTTEVMPYNALDLEFANLGTPVHIFIKYVFSIFSIFFLSLPLLL